MHCPNHASTEIPMYPKSRNLENTSINSFHYLDQFNTRSLSYCIPTSENKITLATEQINDFRHCGFRVHAEVLVEGAGELVERRGNLEALLEDAALAMDAHDLGHLMIT